MKFGKFLENQKKGYPNWKDDFLAYKVLKKHIKKMCSHREKFHGAIDVANASGNSDENTTLLAQTHDEYQRTITDEEIIFFQMLESEVQRLDAFYLHQMRKLKKIFSTLHERSDLIIVKKPYPRKEAHELERDFVEFYRMLDLLKNFCSVNTLAASKIVKKHDHHLGLTTGESYFKTHVEDLEFRSANGLPKLCHQTEKLFASVFEQDNLKRAMGHLRKWHKTRTHWSSFSAGLTFGMCVVLTIFLVWLVFLPPSVTKVPNYFENFVVFRLFGLLLFMIFLWACEVWVWKRNRVNYAYIFEFDQNTTLSFVQVFYICLGFATFYCTCFMLYVGISKKILLPIDDPHIYATMCPLILCLFAIIWIIFPFNKFWRSSRFFMIRTLFKIFLAPFTKVRFSVFFFADVMTSLAKPLVDMEYVACFYLSGMFLEADEYQPRCDGINHWARPFVTLIPYWIRFLQCLRRFYDTHDWHPHFTNAMKYASCCIYIIIAALHEHLSHVWDWSEVLWVIAIIWTTLFTYVWDITMDWGFGKISSKHFILRDDLMYLNRWFYYFAIVSDFVLRCAWVLTITPVSLFVQKDYILFFLAAAEIYRRAQWSIFRLENAYVQNLDEYRSSDIIPIVVDAAGPPRLRIRKRRTPNSNASYSDVVFESMTRNEDSQSEMNMWPGTGSVAGSLDFSTAIVEDPHTGISQDLNKIMMSISSDDYFNNAPAGMSANTAAAAHTRQHHHHHRHTATHIHGPRLRASMPTSPKSDPNRQIQSEDMDISIPGYSTSSGTRTPNRTPNRTPAHSRSSSVSSETEKQDGNRIELGVSNEFQLKNVVQNEISLVIPDEEIENSSISSVSESGIHNRRNNFLDGDGDEYGDEYEGDGNFNDFRRDERMSSISNFRRTLMSHRGSRALVLDVDDDDDD